MPAAPKPGQSGPIRPAFDISAAIEDRRLGRFEYGLVALSWLVTFFDGFDANVIAFAAKPLSADFHLSPTMLGDVFSAGIFGLLLGGFLFGYLGDRYGRRPTIIGAVAAFTVLTFAIAFARSYEDLLVLRFVDGLALGGALPLIWALDAEYAPRRARATVITVIMLGYGFGVAAAGPVARAVLPAFGWPGVFVVGAALSLIATVLLVVALPESLRYLVARGDRSHRIVRLLQRMEVAVPAGERGAEHPRFILPDEPVRPDERFRIAELFEGRLKWLTPALWTAYFASSFATFFLSSWGPLLLENLGFSADNAAYVTSLNSVCAALGGLGLMRFTDRHGAIAIAVLPLLSVPILAYVGLAPITLLIFLLLGVPISIFLGGTHYGVISIISSSYPSVIRANGSGWCSAVGKIGSVLGPLVGGYLLASNLSVQHLYALLAICPAVTGVAVLAVGLIDREPAQGETAREAAATN